MVAPLVKNLIKELVGQNGMVDVLTALRGVAGDDTFRSKGCKDHGHYVSIESNINKALNSAKLLKGIDDETTR